MRARHRRHRTRARSRLGARVSTIQGPSGQSEEDIEKNTTLLREQVMPNARAMGGFKGVLALADAGSGKGLTITLWESAEALRASEEAADRIRAQAADLSGGQIASVEQFQVILDEPVS